MEKILANVLSIISLIVLELLCVYSIAVGYHLVFKAVSVFIFTVTFMVLWLTVDETIYLIKRRKKK